MIKNHAINIFICWSLLTFCFVTNNSSQGNPTIQDYDQAKIGVENSEIITYQLLTYTSSEFSTNGETISQNTNTIYNLTNSILISRLEEFSIKIISDNPRSNSYGEYLIDVQWTHDQTHENGSLVIGDLIVYSIDWDNYISSKSLEIETFKTQYSDLGYVIEYNFDVVDDLVIFSLNQEQNYESSLDSEKFNSYFVSNLEVHINKTNGIMLYHAFQQKFEKSYYDTQTQKYIDQIITLEELEIKNLEYEFHNHKSENPIGILYFNSKILFFGLLVLIPLYSNSSKREFHHLY